MTMPPRRPSAWRNPVVLALAAVLTALVLLMGAGLVARALAPDAAPPTPTAPAAPSSFPSPPPAPLITRPDVAPDVSGPTLIGVAVMVPGVCLEVLAYDNATGARLDYMTRLPCSSPHRAEVIGVVTVPDGPYPGDETITGEITDAACDPLYDKYDQYVPAQTGAQIGNVTPNQFSWEDSGNRRIVCAISYPAETGVLVTGSAVLGQMLEVAS